MRSEHAKQAVAVEMVPVFDAEKCSGEIYKADMLTRHASQIAEIARDVKNGNGETEAKLRDYAQSFAARLRIEPVRLCGNDEHLHPEDASALLAISAISAGMSSLVNGHRREQLDEVSDKASKLVFDNIPLREIEEASLIFNSFSEYFVSCIADE